MASPPEPSASISEVGRTSLGTAYIRSIESAKPDRLFDDPLAATFVEASGWQPASRSAESQGARSRAYYALIAFWVVIRTRYLDDLLVGATADGIDQLVFVGAGMDARAFRLDLPAHTRVYEIDRPEIFDFKDETLTRAGAQPRCERVTVACDLRDDWLGALTTAGFDAARPTIWIAEGVLAYLEETDAADLLDTITSSSAPGSVLGASLASPAVLDRAAAGGTDDARALWRSSSPEDAKGWLRSLGWDADVAPAAQCAERYGRTPPIATERSSGGRLVRAVRVSS